jgi:hypothetical protein
VQSEPPPVAFQSGQQVLAVGPGPGKAGAAQVDAGDGRVAQVGAEDGPPDSVDRRAAVRCTASPSTGVGYPGS